jgi:hypothetical protein
LKEKNRTAINKQFTSNLPRTCAYKFIKIVFFYGQGGITNAILAINIKAALKIAAIRFPCLMQR